MENMCKEALVAYCKALSCYLPLEAEESHENLVRRVVPAEIRTQHLANASQKHYRLCQYARHSPVEKYVGVLISLRLSRFAAQPEEFFLDRLKKVEQRSHKHVELRREYVE
jgi:hypothetical protein